MHLKSYSLRCVLYPYHDIVVKIFCILLQCTRVLTAGYCCNNCIVFKCWPGFRECVYAGLYRSPLGIMSRFGLASSMSFTCKNPCKHIDRRCFPQPFRPLRCGVCLDDVVQFFKCLFIHQGTHDPPWGWSEGQGIISSASTLTGRYRDLRVNVQKL